MEYLAPIALSWTTMVHGIEYFKTKSESVVLKTLVLGVSYFIGDALYILLARKKEYYMYIVHHILAAYIGICGYFGYINLHVLAPYFIAFEFSNLFLNIWSLTNKLKKYDTLNYITFPLTLCTYIPTRTLVLPIVTRDIFNDSWSRGRYELCFVYIALLWLSFMYSRILLQITMKKLPKYNLDQEQFWSMFTYVYKLYLTIYHTCVHKFYLFGILDLIHIFISWMYNITHYSQFYQRLDIISIHSRMVASNILSCYFLPPNYYTLFANFVLMTLLVKNFNKIQLTKHRNFYFWLYVSHFVTSVYNGRNLISFWYYIFIIFAGLSWFLRVPERFIKTSFTSLPLMHIFIILSDECIYQLNLY